MTEIANDLVRENVEIRNEISISTRLKKLEMMNREKKDEMLLFFRVNGFSDQTYHRLKRGDTKGQPHHIGLLNKMVEHLKLIEE